MGTEIPNLLGFERSVRSVQVQSLLEKIKAGFQDLFDFVSPDEFSIDQFGEEP